MYTHTHTNMQVGPRQWQRVLAMVSKIRGLGMEVCTTLGMITPEQVRRGSIAGVQCVHEA